MSTYLTNLSKNANGILTRIQYNQYQNDVDPTITTPQYLAKVDTNANEMKIYSFLKKYSADVLHDKIKLDVETIVKAEVKVEVKVEPDTIKSEPTIESPTNSSTMTPPKSVSSLKSSPDEEKHEPLPPPVPQNLKTWPAAELRSLFVPLLDRVCCEKDAEVFLRPVDWQLLEIPDYPRIVTNPMDLATIRTHLDDEQRYSDPWDVVADFWLMFNNAWTYNKRSSRVYKMCSSVAKLFETLADKLMRQEGLCCGHDYEYLPQVLICCTPQMCVVPRDAVYYAVDNSGPDDADRPVPELGCDRYVCCEKCFGEAAEGDTVQLMVSESTATLV